MSEPNQEETTPVSENPPLEPQPEDATPAETPPPEAASLTELAAEPAVSAEASLTESATESTEASTPSDTAATEPPAESAAPTAAEVGAAAAATVAGAATASSNANETASESTETATAPTTAAEAGTEVAPAPAPQYPSHMYAIVAASGAQHFMVPGRRVTLQKIQHVEGDVVEFEQVLLTNDGNGNLQIGQPYVTGAKVVGKVYRQTKGPKIHVGFYKRRKNFRRHVGHRQQLTEVLIENIIMATADNK